MSDQPTFRVMVTRPKPQGEDLCQHLQAQGYDTVFLPVIEIQALPDLSLLGQQIAELDQYDWAIFVSRSAVVMSQKLIHQRWPQLPLRLQVAAVGQGTAEALKRAGIPVTVYPTSEWSSEGLLAVPAFQDLSGKKVAIFCGKGGRDLLQSSLQERGAQVQQFISYQRQLPKVDMTPSLKLLNKGQLDVILCTSLESLSNLRKLFGKPAWPRLKKIPLVLISERIMIQAKEFGFETCILAKNASHEGIAETLQIIRNKAMTVEEMKSQEVKAHQAQLDEAESKVNPAPTEPKNSSLPKLIAAFLVCMTVVLIGAGGFFYYRIFNLNTHVASALVSFAHQTKWNQHQISDLQGEYTALQQRVQQLDQALQRQSQLLQGIHGSSANAALNRGQDYNAVLDAQYFTRLAADQLLLTNDVPQAINFLTQAQNELKTVSDSRSAPLKKSVEEDLATLKKLPWTDTNDLYSRLLTLQKQVQKLPLLLVPTQDVQASATSANEENSGWAQGLKHFWEAMKKMVTVYRLPNQNTPPFVTPDLRPYVYENMRALLNQASWAVLNNNPSVYAGSLEQAEAWVRQYFSGESALTTNALNEIQALQGITLQQTKEVALTSLKVFQEYLKPEPAATTSAT